MSVQNDDISINTMIGAGSFVVGKLEVEGFVRIDGSIDGNLKTTGKIIIGENAKIRGNVSAKSVINGGIIEGNIIAPESVELFSSAVVFGDIISKKIKAEQNAIIEGFCISISDTEEFEQLKNQWTDKCAIAEKNVFGKNR